MAVSKGSALQIRVSAQQLSAFRAYAKKRGTTMSGLVLGWVEAALAGRDGELPGAASPPAAEAPGRQEELLAELRVQTALLQRLVAALPIELGGSLVAALPIEPGGSLVEGQGGSRSPMSPLGDGPAALAGGDVEE